MPPFQHEKSHKESKKWLAAMEFSRTWSVIIIATLAATGAAQWANAVALATGLTTVLLAEIIVLGFVQVLYLGGQTAVDTFVRVAAIIAGMLTGRKVEMPDGPGHAPDENAEDEVAEAA